MSFNWDPEKNLWLAQNRGITFEEIVCLVDEGHALAVLEHPGRPHQKILVVERDGYAYNVPFVEDTDGDRFLKTVYPSRASTRRFLGRQT